MKNILFRFALLIAVCFVSGSIKIFAQCGADGTQPCPTTQKKGTPKKTTLSQPPKRKSADSNSKKPVAVSADGSGTVYRETSAGGTLVVKYEEESNNLIFTIEAVTDFTNDLPKEYSGDGFEIYFDSNKNNRVDCKDIGYTGRSGNKFYVDYFSMG